MLAAPDWGSPRLRVLPAGETQPSPAAAVSCSFVNFYLLKTNHGQNKTVLAAAMEAEAGGMSHHVPWWRSGLATRAVWTLAMRKGTEQVLRAAGVGGDVALRPVAPSEFQGDYLPLAARNTFAFHTVSRFLSFPHLQIFLHLRSFWRRIKGSHEGP